MVFIDKVRHVFVHGHERPPLLLLKLLLCDLLLQSKFNTFRTSLLVLHMHLFDHLSSHFVLHQIDQSVSAKGWNFLAMRRAHIVNQVLVLSDHDTLVSILLVVTIAI